MPQCFSLWSTLCRSLIPQDLHESERKIERARDVFVRHLSLKHLPYSSDTTLGVFFVDVIPRPDGTLRSHLFRVFALSFSQGMVLLTDPNLCLRLGVAHPFSNPKRET